MKISFLRSLRAIRKIKLSAFTLIEILVVISIIAVLAGLLFPAMGAVRDQARRTSAKNDVTQIVNAIRNFYVDYGRYPDVSREAYTDNNSVIINALRAEGTGTNAGANPRAIRYLEVPVKSGSNSGGVVRSGINKENNDGIWLDPWSKGYIIYIDHDYDDSISVTYNGTSDTLRTGAAAKSLGKSGSANGKTEVVSWE